jgi:hypothetical protein
MRKYNLFTLPPNWEHIKPKQTKRYRHEVTVASTENAEYAYTLYFTSEKKARDYKRTVLESTNNPIVEYQRKELPVQNGEWIEQ